MLNFLSRLLSSTARVIRETVRLIYDVTTGLFVRRVERHVEPPAPSIDMDSMMSGVSQAFEMSRAAATVKRYAKAVTEGRRDVRDLPEAPESVRAWLSQLSLRQLRMIGETPLSRVREHVKGKRLIEGLPGLHETRQAAVPARKSLPPMRPRALQRAPSRDVNDEFLRAMLS